MLKIVLQDLSLQHFYFTCNYGLSLSLVFELEMSLHCRVLVQRNLWVILPSAVQFVALPAFGQCPGILLGDRGTCK